MQIKCLEKSGKRHHREICFTGKKVMTFSLTVMSSKIIKNK